MKWEGRSMIENSHGLKPDGGMFTETVTTVEKYGTEMVAWLRVNSKAEKTLF